jgi:hypothetical protein
MKVKFLVIAASLAASFAGMPAANAAALWGADQQATTAEMDNQLNQDAARYGYGTNARTHRYEGVRR